MQPMSNHNPSKNGFTLVEMLVVIPMIVIIIGVLIGLMVTLINNVATTNGRTQLLYDTQDALAKIEQDTFRSEGFLSTFTPSSPQDINNGGSLAFTSVTGSASSIILNQYGTTTNPADAARGIVYYANRPYSCALNYKANQKFYVKTIYFIKDSTLYRRSIVPLNNQNVTPDTDTTCAKPWQRGSCASGVPGALCLSVDSKLVAGVSAMTLFYYKKADPGTATTPEAADSIRVTLSPTQTAGGNDISLSLSLAASRTSAQ